MISNAGKLFLIEKINDGTYIEFVASMLFLKKYYPNDNDAETVRKLRDQKPNV
jgi:hypothetical protein